MAGAIIPNDWDGSTFECQRIEWPASPQWQAILLGQVSEPTKPFYWDDTTGDVDDAVEAVETAFELTVPNIYSQECDDVPNLPVIAFKVEINTPFAIPAALWTTIPWADYFYQHNNPGFDFVAEGHKPTQQGHLGISAG